MTAAELRAKAQAEIEAAQAENEEETAETVSMVTGEA